MTLTKLKDQTSKSCQRRQPFSCNRARPHNSLKTIEHTTHLGWAVLPHPPYYLDLLPSVFHVFGMMKMGCMSDIFL